MQYTDFLREVIVDKGLKFLPLIYHQVRNIPYGSNGSRDPRIVYESNVGSCSGKHILLRDLLREAGHKAEIITMFTYFNESTPICDSFSEELKTLGASTRIPDFHHYVRVKKQGKWLKLDATWHDGLAAFGFKVNSDWAGQGDTALASVAEREYPNEEDIIAFKAHLVDSLPSDQREVRAKYFAMVTGWIAENAASNGT